MRTLKEIRSLVRAGYTAVPLTRAVPADAITPVAAFLRLSRGHARSFLLESVEGGERVARFSFLGADPRETLRIRDGRTLVESKEGTRALEGEPLGALARHLGRLRAPREPGLPRFCGGAVGMAAYELAGLLEPSSGLRPPEDDAARLMVFDRAAAFDHVRREVVLAANVIAEPGRSLARAAEAAAESLHAMELRLGRPAPQEALGSRAAPLRPPPFPPGLLGRRRFLEGVRRLKRHIAAGDIFQGVLSERFERPISAEPFSVYRALRGVNPSPYMFFVDMEDETALGASPEMLIRVENGEVETRPIAGTRPRGADEAADRALEAGLLASVKERAEHLMLVDLGRNDIGRTAKPGSVRLASFMQVERYSHVMHLVSSVRGRLRAGLGAWDAFAAAFPAGTVTGAPKIRAMQLLAGLEPAPRGLYAGAVVYCDFQGNLDSAIAIRSLAVLGRGRRRRARVQAGAGVVADSVPEREYEEVLNKSRAMMRAIQIAEERRG